MVKINYFSKTMTCTQKFKPAICCPSASATHCYGEYYINDSVISPMESVKDLGITVNSFLKFHAHTSIVAARTNQMIALTKSLSTRTLACYFNC